VDEPHSHIYLDVKDAGGKVVNWQFEGHPSVAGGHLRAAARPRAEVVARGTLGFVSAFV
jgi:hypothetical protein